MTLIAAEQNRREVTADTARIRMDKALTAAFDADRSAGNVTATAAHMHRAVLIRAINATTAGRRVTQHAGIFSQPRI